MASRCVLERNGEAAATAALLPKTRLVLSVRTSSQRHVPLDRRREGLVQCAVVANGGWRDVRLGYERTGRLPARGQGAWSAARVGALVLAACLVACADPGWQGNSPLVGWVDERRVLAAADAEPGSWLAHGQTYDELRFPSLTQINRDTVQGLGLAWFKNLRNRHRAQTTPLVIDGVMYFTDAWSVAYAVNAKTGEELWRFDPLTDKRSIRYACCGGAINRGMAAYKGKLYLATFDARLFALDQATGEKLWDVDTSLRPSHNPYTVTGAPRVVRDKVFIGQSSSEFGLRGYLSAYDANTGELAWRFFTVPGDPSKPFEHPELEAAAKTWGAGSGGNSVAAARCGTPSSTTPISINCWSAPATAPRGRAPSVRPAAATTISSAAFSRSIPTTAA